MSHPLSLSSAWGDLLQLSFACDTDSFSRLNYGFEYKGGKWIEVEYDAFAWMEHHEEQVSGEIKGAMGGWCVRSTTLVTRHYLLRLIIISLLLANDCWLPAGSRYRVNLIIHRNRGSDNGQAMSCELWADFVSLEYSSQIRRSPIERITEAEDIYRRYRFRHPCFMRCRFLSSLLTLKKNFPDFSRFVRNDRKKYSPHYRPLIKVARVCIIPYSLPKVSTRSSALFRLVDLTINCKG